MYTNGRDSRRGIMFCRPLKERNAYYTAEPQQLTAELQSFDP